MILQLFPSRYSVRIYTHVYLYTHIYAYTHTPSYFLFGKPPDAAIMHVTLKYFSTSVSKAKPFLY